MNTGPATDSGEERRILYVIPYSTVGGGAEQALIYLFQNINRERFRPVAILPDGPMRELLNGMGIKTYVSETNYLWFPTRRHYYTLLRGLKGSLKQVMDILEKDRIDIIHTNDYWAFDGGLAGVMTGIPHIWHLHIPLMSTHPLFEYFPLRSPSFGEIIQALSDVVVAVSSGVRDSLMPSVTREKIHVIYNGIDIEKYHGDTHGKPLHKELGISGDSIIITSVGRICRQKCFEDFVEAAGILSRQRKDVTFLLVGPTSDDEQQRAELLRRRVSELGLTQSFLFLGRREDVAGILAETDIFVSCSLYEGHPLVILEAMASRKPVVATNCIGSEEVVLDGETGYLVGINKPDELASALLRLLNDADARRSMGLRGRKRVMEVFGLASFVAHFETLYSQVRKVHNARTRSTIWPEFVVNTLSEIGELGLKSIEHEHRIKQMENFVDSLKRNSFYRGVRKVYRAITSK